MFGEEAEHDGPLETGAIPSSCSSAQFGAVQMKATDEPQDSRVKLDGIKFGSELWPHFSGVQQMNAALERMRNMTVEEVHVLPFTETCLLLGDVCQLTVNTLGINTPLRTMGEGQREDDCCAHLWAPEGIVRPGLRVMLHYTIILDGPFSFPNGYRRVSSVLFLCCNNPQELQKELTIQLRHWADVTGKGSGLCFMKANHELGSDESCYSFKPVEGGDFDQDSGCLRLKDHFCLLCTAIDDSKEYKSDWFYAILCSKRDQQFRICIAYGVPSWKKAIKEFYWNESGKDALTFDYEKFTCQNKDDAYVCLSAPTLTGVAGGGWQYSALRTKVELKELATDNLQQSHRCDQTEVAAGLYPPSLKFRITYEYEIKDDYKRRPHTVSLTGSDNFREVSFGIDVFERPTTELDTQQCPAKAGSNFSSPIQEQNRAAKEDLATNRKKTAQESSVLAPGILSTSHPTSDDQSTPNLEPFHEDSRYDGTQQMTSDQDEPMLQAEEEHVIPFSVTTFLVKWSEEFFDVVNAKQNVLMLVRKNVIPPDVATAIEDANDEKAKEILYAHLKDNGNMETLREYCMAACSANGYPKMQSLAREMLKNLPQGDPSPSHGRYAPSASVSWPDASTVPWKLHRTATCLTSPRTGGIEEASSSHQDEAARAKTAPVT